MVVEVLMSEPLAPVVVLRGVTRTYRRAGTPVAALRGVDLEVAVGELVVLMGPSGSGKSVFLRHLIGLEAPDTGEILLLSLIHI